MAGIKQGRYLLLGLLVSAMLWLVGCGAGARPAESMVVVDETPTALRLLSWQFSEAWEQTETALLRDFQEKQPQWEIEQERYQRLPSLYLTEANPPDLMGLTAGYMLADAAHQNQIIPLADLWQSAGFNQTVPATLADLTTYDGQQYYLPVGYTWTAIYYNKAVFERYQLNPPQTWDEFQLICETLLANGETPLALSGNGFGSGMLWFDYFGLRLNGPDFQHELVTGQVSYDDPQVQAVMERWQEMFTLGYFVERPNIMNDFDTMVSLVRGDNGELSSQKAVMVLIDSGQLSDLPELFRNELDFFRFPILDDSLPVAEVISPLGYVIPRQGSQVPATMRFLEYVGSAETQTFLASRLDPNLAPLRDDVDAGSLAPSQRQARDMIRAADQIVIAHLFNSPSPMWGQLNNGFSRFINKPEEIGPILQSFEEGRQQALEQDAFHE
jgi:multiple sugar transport system substrate-binding protein/raffinose/stachyose/melibiose transport system substrate-binding protein